MSFWPLGDRRKIKNTGLVLAAVIIIIIINNNNKETPLIFCNMLLK